MPGKGIRDVVSEKVTSQQRPEGGEGCLEEELSKQEKLQVQRP